MFARNSSNSSSDMQRLRHCCWFCITVAAFWKQCSVSTFIFSHIASCNNNRIIALWGLNINTSFFLLEESEKKHHVEIKHVCRQKLLFVWRIVVSDIPDWYNYYIWNRVLNPGSNLGSTGARQSAAIVRSDGRYHHNSLLSGSRQHPVLCYYLKL